MKTNPLKQGALTENSAGIGTVTPKMVQERAAELAVINGRPAKDALKSDWTRLNGKTVSPKADPENEDKVDAYEQVIDPAELVRRIHR